MKQSKHAARSQPGRVLTVLEEDVSKVCSAVFLAAYLLLTRPHSPAWWKASVAGRQNAGSNSRISVSSSSSSINNTSTTITPTAIGPSRGAFEYEYLLTSWSNSACPPLELSSTKEVAELLFPGEIVLLHVSSSPAPKHVKPRRLPVEGRGREKQDRVR